MTALSQATRRRMFYLLLVLFLVVAPLAILYSQGYVVDLKTRRLQPTGGVFVKTRQPGGRVFINGEFQRETSFVSRGVLITNLAPKRYALRVERAGARSWEKVLRVADGEVIEFRNVFLPSATITPRVIFNIRRGAAARLEVLSGRPEIAVTVADPPRGETMFVVDPATRSAPVNFVRVARWQWDERWRSFAIMRTVGGSSQWFRLRMDAGASRREEAITFRGLPPGFSAEAVVPHPTEPDHLYFLAGGALFLQGSARVPTPIAEQIEVFAVGRERIYFLSKNGFFVETDLGGQNTKVLGRKGLFRTADQPVVIRVAPAGDVIVRDSAGGLFTYRDGQDTELQFIAGNVAGFDFDAGGGRMLYWDENRIWIYWLRDNPVQPFDLARTKHRVFFSEEPIRGAFLDAGGSQVFFLTQRGIRMVETDDRGSTNAYDLVTGAIDAFAIAEEPLTLWWVERSTVKQSALE